MEIGSHSLHHVRLPEVSDAQLRDEVAESRERLAELTGRPVTGFCYPYGAVGDREVQAVRAAGYEYAVRGRPSGLNSRHAMPRAFVGDRDGSARLYAKVARHRLTVGQGRAMRVLHVITGLAAGGAEHQLRLLVRRLPYDCEVVALSNAGHGRRRDPGRRHDRA